MEQSSEIKELIGKMPGLCFETEVSQIGTSFVCLDVLPACRASDCLRVELQAVVSIHVGEGN